MVPATDSPTSTLANDLKAGLVVFLVALPLCLGVALASNAPLFSGVLAGIVGGVVVGLLSGSHTSVSGPAAGLTAIVAAQIVSLGSFQTFLLAVVLAGVLQIILGAARAGFIADFVPSSVIKGLLAAIGVILILKQIPHLVGHDPDPPGDLSFHQTDHQTTFSEIYHMLDDFQPGAAVIGLLSLALLVLWDRIKPLKKSVVPAPLIVVLLGVAIGRLAEALGGRWAIDTSHMVQVPIADDFAGFLGFFQAPDFSQWLNPAVYMAAVTIAAVASLETLLNLEAVDKIDPQRRTSPPSRELMAQGAGNMVAGLIGGIPITSVIVRSSVNVNAGGRTKLSAVFHGSLLLACVMTIPAWLNLIPLSCLAAILLMAGVKLASPAIVKGMWSEGRYKFIPFAMTMASIVLTDLLIGVMIGLATSMSFILWSNARRPIRRIVEKHLDGELVRIELANQVSFLSRAAMARTLDEVPAGGQAVIDATKTNFIEPDVLGLIQDFHDKTGPARGVKVSMLGFRPEYEFADEDHYMDYATHEQRSALTPAQVLRILKDGHERFRSGRHLTRDLSRSLNAPASGRHPLAVVLSCIDARTPSELIFDVSVGDFYVTRVAGNIASPEVLGGIEYACVVGGAKVVLVMGHTHCGAVAAAVDQFHSAKASADAKGCDHLATVVREIQKSTPPRSHALSDRSRGAAKGSLVDDVARRNVESVVDAVVDRSQTLEQLVREGRVVVVGLMFDVATGEVDFLPAPAPAPAPAPDRDQMPRSRAS